KIRAHGSIVVEAAEEIWIPNNRYGILVPTGSMFLSRGILIAPAKIEPAFRGRMKLRLFNTTSKKTIVKKGEKLGSAVFFQTESTEIRTPIQRPSEISIP